jgi:hypothetical protein
MNISGRSMADKSCRGGEVEKRKEKTKGGDEKENRRRD